MSRIYCQATGTGTGPGPGIGDWGSRKIHKEGATNSGTEIQLHIRIDQS